MATANNSTDTNLTATWGEVPKVATGREAKPNEFLPLVTELNKRRGESVTLSPFTVKNNEGELRVQAVIRDLRRAAGKMEPKCSVRVKLNVAKDKSATLTVWAVDKIARPVKDENDADALQEANA